MTTVVIRRSARRPAPPIPTGDVVVPAPPAIAGVGPSRWTHILMAVPMLAGTVATALLFAGRQGGAYSYVVGGVFGLSSLGMLAASMASGAGRRDRVDVAAVRREYAQTLAVVRKQVRANALALRSALTYRHPAPSTLVTIVDSGRLWERRGNDADFGAVRVGLGPQELTTPLVPAIGTADDLDPIGLAAMRRLIDAYAAVPDLPVAMATNEFARIRISDAGLVRALLAQLVFAHAPADLLVAVCAEEDRLADWDFLKWLPHHQHPRLQDATGSMRLAAVRLGDLETMLTDVIEGRPAFGGPTGERRLPLVVIVIDGSDRTGAKRLASPAGIAGCCVISLTGDFDADSASAIALTVTADGRLLADEEDVGTPDTLSIVEAEALARSLAPLRLVEAVASRSQGTQAITLDGLLGLGDPLASSIRSAWTGRSPADRLRVPIGVQPSGQPVLLDLKEAARDGMGPHGLLIGATGSGKSELLRTLVLSLAASHDSNELNFVLIDFKGGATFASLDRLPHTAAVITNLADELPLVDRMTDALNGELVRRQEVLRRAGNLASLHDYERARAADPTLAPLPVLLIVCDEFSELLSAKPDFIDLFVAIGRLGRSLGVHLLLASQRLDEGRLRGLDTHLSYRIGLRTFSALESRSVLGVPDAYELPRSPGHGYLKYGTDPLVRFTAAYSSGPYASSATEAVPVAPDVPAGGWEIVPFTSAPVRPRRTPTAPTPPIAGTQTLLDAMTGAMVGAGVPAHRVWLPPLATSEPLDALLGPLTIDPVRGRTTVEATLHGRLLVSVAIIDKPFEQRRDPLWLTLDAAAGHVAIVGGPQAGKSSLVRTLVTSLALTHTPREATCYCLDFGGGSLATLRDLPHVGAVVGRLESESVRRTIGDIAALLASRERLFAADRVADIDEARRRGTPLDPYGDVFLVIDGWATARSDYDDLEPVITDIATRGLSYGVHVIVTATRWADLRPALRDLLGSRLELRLGDPGDSQIGRRIAATVPAGSPGRGLTLDSLHFLAAITTQEEIKAIAAAWSGPAAPAIRELPALVPFAQLASANTDASDLVLPIGIAESDLRPISIDFAADPHLLVFGEPGSGKSSALRLLAAAIIARYPPERARLVVIDYRRSMLGEINDEHLIGYATADGPAATLLGSVAEYMQRRRPGPDVTPRELRARSWWTGPECFVLVDDYDLVAGGTNPLLALLDFLSQAGDVGLHVIIARRSGGAARALFEPVFARLRELATPGLILSGDREDGALVGTVRPQPLPPGRAILVDRRDGGRLVQLGYLAPVELPPIEGDAESLKTEA